MPDIVALLFGAVIILAFSYERFNQATYQDGRQLERLVDLLSPDTLRARRIVRQAFLFYAGALLLIYLFLCAYAEVLPLIGGPDLGVGTVGAERLPVTSSDGSDIGTTGFNPRGDGINIDWSQTLSSAAGPTDSGRTFDIGIDPKVSLTIALIIIGLAPSFPILRHFEDWMRVSAHQIAGIPTHVIGIRDDLRRNALDLLARDDSDPPVDTLLIPQGDWERMLHYSQVAESKLNAPDAFRDDIQLILAISAWFFDRKLKGANAQERDRLDRLEGRLRDRKDALIQQLDERSDFVPGEMRPAGALTAAKPAAGNNGIAADLDGPTGAKQNESDGSNEAVIRAGWERLAREADQLADDIGTLLALYIEHSVVFAPDPTRPDVKEDDEQPKKLRDPVRQQGLAEKKLQSYLAAVGNHAASAHKRSYTTMTWFWTLGVVLGVTLLWSRLPTGRFEVELQRTRRATRTSGR